MESAKAPAHPDLTPSPRRSGLRRAAIGLQTRFTIHVIALVLIVATVVGTITFNLSARLVRRSHAQHCRGTVAMLAEYASPAFADGPAALKQFANEIVDNDSILFVSLMENNGNELALAQGGRLTGASRPTTGFTPQTTIGRPRFIDTHGRSPAYFDVTYPVRRHADTNHVESNDPILLGYIRIGLSLERTLTEVNAAIELLRGIAVLISALTVPLAFFVVRRIVHPLLDLAAAMRRFAGGDMNARANLKRDDELGDVATAFNDMAERLETKHEEIVALNAQLEERVHERTRQLRELAIRDGLTGLYNRRHFSEVLERSFAEAQRYNSELACMMVDLDNFKAVNDTLGHQAGDDVLVRVAGIVRDAVRSADLVARFGGDEFVVLLPHTDVAHAYTLAGRIQETLSASVVKRARDCNVTLSIGVASIREPGVECPDDLIRLADNAMYAAKGNGKNRVVVHELS